MTSPINAANAYRNHLKLLEGMDDSAQSAESGGASFKDMLSNTLKDAEDSIYKGEAMKMDALTQGNKVNMADLVTAVSSAELTLNTVVAVRDRVVDGWRTRHGLYVAKDIAV